ARQDQAEAKGEAKGRAEGHQAALLIMLRTRGLAPSRDDVRRIRACADIAKLERWIARASVATSMREVFGPRSSPPPAPRKAKATRSKTRSARAPLPKRRPSPTARPTPPPAGASPTPPPPHPPPPAPIRRSHRRSPLHKLRRHRPAESFEEPEEVVDRVCGVAREGGGVGEEEGPIRVECFP